MSHPIDEEPSPRERRFARTQQAILHAARVIIHEQGVDKLSMRAIADRIDYSPAGLYEYFGSKEEIVAQVARQGHRLLRQAMLRVAPDLAPRDYLVEIGLAYIDFAVHNPDYFSLMFTQSVAPAPDPGLDLNSHEFMDADSSFPLLLGGVQRMIEAGLIRPRAGLGVWEIAYCFWAIVHGIAMLRTTYLRDMPMNYASVDRAALEAFGRGMAE
jgi:AcrR family transcriptional regulator